MPSVSFAKEPTGISARNIQLAAGYAVGIAVITAFFFRFVLPACHTHFAPDDPMAMYYYWTRGPWSLVKGLVLFPSTYLRPMHGVYYSVLYYFFGLNPLPYHIVISGLILLNAFLAYRFAVLISGSRLIGAITAVAATYHAELSALYFMPSFGNDVICFTFFFLALNYYVAIRNRQLLLTVTQATIFLVLYVCALDSKEMAISLPVIALLYEVIWHGPRPANRDLQRWVRRNALVLLIASLMTCVYIIGKIRGAESLTTNPQYQTAYTWQRFVEAYVRFCNTFFFVSFTEHAFTPAKLFLLWAALLIVAWHLRAKHLLFATVTMIITPLPIAFIPLRPGANLYIPLVGWAICVSTVWLALANVFSRVPLVRRVPTVAFRCVLALLMVVWLWKSDVRDNRRFLPPLYAMETQTWSAIEQLRAVQPTVRPGTHIIFLHDPFQGWDMKFIAELLYHDHSVTATLNRLTPVTAEQLANAEIVFDWQGGQLLLIKRRDPDAGFSFTPRRETGD